MSIRLRPRDFTLIDPPSTLAAILRAGDARPGRTLVAYVHGDGQELRGVRTLDTPTPIPRHDRSSRRASGDVHSVLGEQLRHVAQELVPPLTWDGVSGSPLTGELYTVVCREGRVVDTLVESQFLYAWHYSNHGTSAFSADTYVVTPHGWTGTFDPRAGMEPRLSPYVGGRAPEMTPAR